MAGNSANGDGNSGGTACEDTEPDFNHKWHLVALVIITLVVLVIATIFNALSATGTTSLYLEDTAVISAKYDTDLTPANWTFSIWFVIFIWQFLWMLYAVSHLCRAGINGFLYYSPTLLPWYFYITYILNQVVVVCWTFLFDREKMIWALVGLIGTVVTVYACLFASTTCLKAERKALVRNGFVNEPGLVVGFVHNGLGIYGAWATIATHLNVVIVMHYVADVNMENSTTTALVILLVIFLTWVTVDNMLLDSYTRWLVTPYIVYIWALAGVLHKNYDTAGTRNTILSLIVLILACFGLICKLVISTFRQCMHSRTLSDDQNNPGAKVRKDPGITHKIYEASNGDKYKHFKVYEATDGNLYKF